MRTRDLGDLLAGGSAILIGIVFTSVAYSYGLGRISRMGPGFFPFLVGSILVLLGLVVLLPALFRSGTVPRPEWRPLVFVAGSILAFSALVRPFGLIPAILAAVLLSARADSTARPASTAVLAIALALGTWLVFGVALGVAVPAFGTAR